MKTILSILLIIVMGMSQQKENNMPVDEGNREAIRTIRTSTPQPKPSTPAWMQRIKDKINQLGAPTGMGGGNAIVPNFNTPSTIQAGQTAYNERPQTPSWLQALRDRESVLNNLGTPTGMGGGNAIVPNFNTPMNARPAYPGYGQQQPAPNINPNMPTTPTGSFLAADGDVAQGTNGGAVPTSIPTGSVLAANGQAVLGPNGSQAYWPFMPAGVNTFIGAGGQAVRGPDGGAIQTGDAGYGGGGGGFGTRYRGWGGRGGGGGGWSDYGSSPAWTSNDPAYMNLYSWNYKG